MVNLLSHSLGIKSHGWRLRIVIVCLLGVICAPGTAIAASDLDQDCDPKGWIPKLRAWWDPNSFWSAQIPEIQKEVEQRIRAYQMYLIQRQADAALAANEREKAKIEQATLEAQLKILGVHKPIPSDILEKLEQATAQADEAVAKAYAQTDIAFRRGIGSTMQWAEKCTAHAKQQLTAR